MATALDLYLTAMEESGKKAEASELYKVGAEVEAKRGQAIFSMVSKYPLMVADYLNYIVPALEVIQRESENPKTREGAKEQYSNLLEYQDYINKELKIFDGYNQYMKLRAKIMEAQAEALARQQKAYADQDVGINEGMAKLNELLGQLGKTFMDC